MRGKGCTRMRPSRRSFFKRSWGTLFMSLNSDMAHSIISSDIWVALPLRRVEYWSVLVARFKSDDTSEVAQAAFLVTLMVLDFGRVT
jgi:hypothetical protein